MSLLCRDYFLLFGARHEVWGKRDWPTLFPIASGL
jgi:hypothetical protein